MTLIAGFGYRAAATAESLADALTRARARAGDTSPLARICVPADKADEPCILAFASAEGVSITPIAPDAITEIATPTQAERVIEKRGTGSVAEAAALAGGGTKLIAERVVSDDRMATCALAES